MAAVLTWQQAGGTVIYKVKGENETKKLGVKNSE